MCDIILAWSKLKAFENDRLKVGKMAEFVPDRVENILGKRENANIIFKMLLFHRPFNPT